MIDVSIIASANRVKWWDRVARSLDANDVSWELVFVGDKDPCREIKGLRYIKASVRPAQCYEIGFREAQGRIVSLTADDAEYLPHALDYAVKNITDDKTFVHITSIEDGVDQTDWHRFFGKDGGPMMAPFLFMTKTLYHNLGGWDKRFVGGQGENDIILRAYQYGAKCVVCRDAKVLVHHNEVHGGVGRFRTEYHSHNRKTLLDMWVKDGVLSPVRLCEVNRFNDPISRWVDEW